VVQAAGPQTAQELGAERLRLAVADHQPEDLALPAGGIPVAIIIACETIRWFACALQQVAATELESVMSV
jgi:hypothetical protein